MHLPTLSDKVSRDHAALVVIDMQNDFCDEHGTAGNRGQDLGEVRAMVPTLRSLIANARSGGLPVFFVRCTLTDESMPDNWRDRLGENPFPCLEGSWGADWYGVAPEAGDPVVTKHRFSAFIGTDFDLLLRTRGIQSLILTGTRTNQCVESTARDGFQWGYHIVFVSDCTSTTDPALHQTALATIERSFGQVVTAREIIDAWAHAASSPEH